MNEYEQEETRRIRKCFVCVCVCAFASCILLQLDCHQCLSPLLLIYSFIPTSPTTHMSPDCHHHLFPPSPSSLHRSSNSSFHQYNLFVRLSIHFFIYIYILLFLFSSVIVCCLLTRWSLSLSPLRHTAPLFISSAQLSSVLVVGEQDN